MLYSHKFALDRARAVAFMKGYVKSSRHYFDAVLRKRSGPEFDEVVAITAKHTGARPDLIRRGFPYQDRDGRLMPGDIERQTAWWYAQGLMKAGDAGDEVIGRVYTLADDRRVIDLRKHFVLQKPTGGHIPPALGAATTPANGELYT